MMVTAMMKKPTLALGKREEGRDGGREEEGRRERKEEGRGRIEGEKEGGVEGRDHNTPIHVPEASKVLLVYMYYAVK